MTGSKIVVLNTLTGEVLASDKDGLKYSTEKERIQYKQYINSKLRKQCDNFIFLVYEMCNKINLEKYDTLTQADITRIIYLSTFINYDNELYSKNHKPMTKQIIKKCLNISKSSFNELYNKIIDNEIIYIENNKYLMNKELALKGKLDINSKYDYTRIYIDIVRHLYENTTPSKHKILSNVYRIIPFVNIKYNVVCYNQLEKEAKKIEAIRLIDMCRILDYSVNNITKFKKDLLSIKLKNGENVLGMFTTEKDINEYKIVINPLVYFAGEDIRDVKVFNAMF